MSLSEKQIKIVKDHPLNDLLASFPVKLRLLKESNENWRTDIASLLGCLVDSTAAYHLSCFDGRDNIAVELFPIRLKVRQGGSLKFSDFGPLVDAVVAKSPDTDIWTAVINLIKVVSPPTPPTSTQVPTNIATPLRSSSARISDSETSQIIEQELFFEIRDCIHRSVPGFFKKFFNPATWNDQQSRMLKCLLTHHNGKKWSDFPADSWEKPVWEWLIGLEKDAMAGASYKLHSMRTADEFAERKGQMDILFRKSERANDYRDVLVVGEHKKSHNTREVNAVILQLTRYVRGIFADQPLRRFVHAFTLCGTTMELWIYDRSGLYSSGEFNIHKEPDKFACALVAYTTMDNGMMGLDMCVELNDDCRYVMAKDAEGKEHQVEINKNKLLIRQRAVVCRGTTCYITRDGVAKFSWRSAARQSSEVQQLKLAEARGVEGVAMVVAHREITSIADLRSGLEFSDQTRHKKFRHVGHEQRTGSSTSLRGLDSSGSSRKRKLSGEDTRASSRRRSNSQKSALQQTFHARTSEENDDKPNPSLYTPDRNDPFENRILSCLVVSPAGRVISDFQSVRELLEALRDAIRAHQSLYLKGRILHRDISSNNIIITKPETSNGFKGMLIDLDLAKERDSEPSGARNQTGTMQFMAIEVLRGADHTYRHDLESFFYVLLWMCARYAWDKSKTFRDDDEAAPGESDLRHWEVGSFKDIARAKEGDMTVNGLERIMGEFPKAFGPIEPLCLRTRSLLFGDTARMRLGTPTEDPERLYSAVLSAFDEAISRYLC